MNKKILGIGVLSLALGAIFIAQTVDAYRGNPNVQGPNYSEERHQSMLTAFENNDYEAWKNLMGNRGRVTQVITKDNFAKFAEAHKLTLAGNTTEAQKIRQELGLGLQNGSGKGTGSGMGYRFSR